MSCSPRAGGGLGYAAHEASGTYVWTKCRFGDAEINGWGD